MIKKLRKFNNMTILCITDDLEFKNEISSKLEDCNEVIFVSNYEDDFEKKFDLLVIDYSCKDSMKIVGKISMIHPILPKIAIVKEQDEKVIVDCINRSVISILKYPLDFDNLRLAVIVALNQSKRADKILLKEDIYYDAYRERFYNNNGAIAFTKYEFQVLKLLLDNHDKIIDYDDIKENVWKEKKMSIFTMRNVINKIRNKTYYSIIRNNSSKGYQIDTPDNNKS
ncbi:MAG: winged helix-turn-helix domain-containing protein [Campylobacterota bacterium]|nr:winged helix-turn-helix domain-containing protein [Campylobacterota bacterium]